MKKIIETVRTYLRELTENDFDNLCTILQDKQAMKAYEHAFSDTEVQDWLARQMERYETDGFGLWAVIDQQTEEFIGQIGLTMQDVEDGRELEIGYLLRRKFWHQGFATEVAAACKEYAFTVLGAEKVVSIIRDNNFASQNVAQRNGMVVEKTFVKHYYGVDMPHLVFVAYARDRL